MSGSKRAIASDLDKVDRHQITPEEYEEIPEWTDEMFERADYYDGAKLVRRGRPKSEHPKVAISIRLSEDVLNRFKATGSGWQSRIDGALKEWLDKHANDVPTK